MAIIICPTRGAMAWVLLGPRPGIWCVSEGPNGRLETKSARANANRPRQGNRGASGGNDTCCAIDSQIDLARIAGGQFNLQ